jgi:hypothetical protein
LNRWCDCRFRYLCALLLLLVFSTVVQAKGASRYQQLNNHFHKVLASPKSKLELKLNALLSGAATEEEKAWLIYRWVTYHFKHDVGLASRIGDPAQHSLEMLHKVGGGSCAVYANVTHRLMQMAGLEVKTIYGLVKGGPATASRDGNPVNHVWNAVKVNDVWKIVDSTWGAGFVGEHGFQSLHSDVFFLIPPEKAMLSHFDASDELGFQRAFGVNQSLFAKLPDDALYAAVLGFDSKLILDAARGGARLKLVSTFDLPAGALRVLAAPANGVLDRKAQNFMIESDVYEELMIVQGKSWLPLNRSGKAYSLTFVPDKGELLVMGRRPKQHEFEALLGYRVR